MADDTSKGATGGEGAVLLTGGNPRIPKGEGDGPVRDYIAAMPGWKSAVGQRLDDIIADAVPGVRKGVKWNQPIYRRPDDEGWFVSFRCFTSYVQVHFFRGTSLDPVPPKSSKHAEMRYWDIHEADGVDVVQFRSWIAQASALPGQKL